MGGGYRRGAKTSSGSPQNQTLSSQNDFLGAMGPSCSSRLSSLPLGVHPKLQGEIIPQSTRLNRFCY
jgi:hypothetical protein